jgi:hypothetical protein
MASSGMSRRVAPLRTYVSEEFSSSFIRVTRIDELGTNLAVISLVFLRRVRRLLVRAIVFPSSPIPLTLMTEEPRSPETSVVTRATRRNIQKDSILHNHRREDLKSYIFQYILLLSILCGPDINRVIK